MTKEEVYLNSALQRECVNFGSSRNHGIFNVLCMKCGHRFGRHNHESTGCNEIVSVGDFNVCSCDGFCEDDLFSEVERMRQDAQVG